MFATNRDGDFEIASILADGSGFRLLTNDDNPSDRNPRLSPDGHQVAWTRDGAIYVMSSDGTGAHPVSAAGAASDFAWSPDSARLAFSSSGINVVNADSSGLVNIATGSHPSWEPDGTRLAFTRDNGDIYLITPNGAGESRILDRTTDANFSIAWSPSDQDIAWIEDRVNPALWTARTNGAAPAQLAGPSVSGIAWSSDGARIVWCGNSDIQTIARDGTGQVNLTNDGGTSTDVSPAWSPDGTKLVFETDRDGDDEVYVMNADGSSPTNLSHDPGFDHVGNWGPCPN